MDKRCRTCRYYDVRPGERIGKDHVRRCLYPFGSPPPMPDSAKPLQWPPRTAFMGRDDGRDCETYEASE